MPDWPGSRGLTNPRTSAKTPDLETGPGRPIRAVGGSVRLDPPSIDVPGSTRLDTKTTSKLSNRISTSLIPALVGHGGAAQHKGCTRRCSQDAHLREDFPHTSQGRPAGGRLRRPSSRRQRPDGSTVRQSRWVRKYSPGGNSHRMGGANTRSVALRGVTGPELCDRRVARRRHAPSGALRPSGDRCEVRRMS
jgi:hypothetical protein